MHILLGRVQPFLTAAQSKQIYDDMNSAAWDVNGDGQVAFRASE